MFGPNLLLYVGRNRFYLSYSFDYIFPYIFSQSFILFKRTIDLIRLNVFVENLNHFYIPSLISILILLILNLSLSSYSYILLLVFLLILISYS